MADKENVSDFKIEKNTKILVNVDEVLPDIIVVTFEFERRSFQGVLLDSTKRNLPYGVSNLHPAFTSTKSDKKEDALYSANQRFTYQEQPNAKHHPIAKPSVRIPAKYKNAKMTVRLRPRQVLCSKCRGICNENSENVVDNTRKRKAVPPPPPGSIAVNTRQQTRDRRTTMADATTSPCPTYLDEEPSANRTVLYPTLIPRLSRLQPEEIMTRSSLTEACPPALTPTYPEEHSERHSDCSSSVAQAEGDAEVPLGAAHEAEADGGTGGTSGTSTSSSSSNGGTNRPLKRMVLRKKRSVGSMEDLWDESVFEEAGVGAAVDPAHNTRTIKISFGRQGEGTILKIPAKIEDLLLPVPSDTDDTADQENLKAKESNARAVRRALKKAKKEAKRRVLLGNPCSSPRYMLGSASPRYTVGGASPRQGLGGASPRYSDILLPRRHKHKVKHKKRHREERKHKESSSAAAASTSEAEMKAVDSEKEAKEEPEEGKEAREEEAVEEAVSSPPPAKERCPRQKLSINLKRLSAHAYTRCGGGDTSPASSEEREDSPDFPPGQPLMMHITAQAVSSGLTADGHRLAVGDIVWGKVQGFPWWPGKVLSITAAEARSPQAHVAWYGSSTSSLMPCDQLSPFLENFKIRYNKKRRGSYKEAIKQATSEARSESPSSTVIAPVVVPPALASPREIDVVS